MFGLFFVPFTFHGTLALKENGQISFILQGQQKKKSKYWDTFLILHINNEIVTNELNELCKNFTKVAIATCNTAN